MMKVSISYPPIESGKGVPLLSQNRQFQWFNNPTYIYPMVPAYAATLLEKNGYEVSWDDGIAEGLSLSEYMRRMMKKQPEIIAIETKTPVVKTHWRIIGSLKEKLPETKIVLMGDHVTALCQESLKKGKVDYVLTGGDYDFLLLSLCNHLSKRSRLEPGIWYKDDGRIKNTGRFRLDHNLDSLPFIDRELTKWWLYSKENGNYKLTPGTYTMVGRDCWWHRCTFCSWTTLYPNFRVRTPRSLVEEIGLLIEKYGVREVFDDTGSFPVGNWLRKFCRLIVEEGYNEEVNLGCNMKFGVLRFEDYKLMSEAGFRLLLFGLESANQKTLDKINKNVNVERIIKECKWASEAGLEPHLTIMVGYPWETKEDAIKTIELAKRLFWRGYASTLQATIVIPYPGTLLFKECKEKGLLVTEDWNDYDMRKAVMRSPMSQDELKEVTQRLYKVFFEPKYVFRRLLAIRSLNDVRFIQRGISKVFGHLKDFRG